MYSRCFSPKFHSPRPRVVDNRYCTVPPVPPTFGFRTTNSSQVEKFSNEQALDQVRLYWANHLNLAAGGGGGGRSGGGAAAAAAPAGGSAATAASRGGGGLSSLARAAAAAAAAQEEEEAQAGSISSRNGGRIGDRIGGGAGKDLSAASSSNAVPILQVQQQHIAGGGAPAAVAKGLPLPERHHQHMTPNALPQAAPVAGIGLREVPQSAPAGGGDGDASGAASDRNGRQAVSGHGPARGDGRGGRRRCDSGSRGGGADWEAATATATEAMRGPLVEALHQIAQVRGTDLFWLRA